MEHVKGYSKLPEQLKEFFKEVHSAHLSAMGAEMRKKHTEDHIESIEWDNAEKCLKVYYDNGEWYQYSSGGWS